MILLPVVMILAAGGMKADARELFAGCRGEPSTVNGRFYVCRDFSATIINLFEGVPLDMLDVLRSSQRAVLPPGLTEAVREETIAGQKVTVLRFTPSDPKAREFGISDGFVVRRGDKHRMAVCTTRSASTPLLEQCAKVLEYFLTRGAPEDLDIEQKPAVSAPAIFGRKLTVPAGCTVASATAENGRIQCPDAMLVWFQVNGKQDPRQLLENAVAPLVKSLSLQVAKERVPCLIEATSTQCLRVFKPGGMVVHAGAVSLKGVNLVVTCASNSAAKPFHPVCNGALIPE